MDGKMDHHPDRADGAAFGYRTDSDFHLAGGADSTKRAEFCVWVHWRQLAANPHAIDIDGCRHHAGHLAGSVDFGIRHS